MILIKSSIFTLHLVYSLLCFEVWYLIHVNCLSFYSCSINISPNYRKYIINVLSKIMTFFFTLGLDYKKTYHIVMIMYLSCVSDKKYIHICKNYIYCYHFKSTHQYRFFGDVTKTHFRWIITNMCTLI